MQILNTPEEQVNQNQLPSFYNLSEEQTIESMVKNLRPVYPGGVPILVKEGFRSRRTNAEVTVKKCACGSVWCPDCYKRDYLPGYVEKLKTMDWRKVRTVMLSCDPSLTENGMEVLEEVRVKREIAAYMRNIQRGRKDEKPVKVIKWARFLEWHKNGYPHWHLFIEVDKPGKLGMIGGDRLRRYWKRGRVTEGYIHNQEHWDNITGYFEKSGYFEKGKAYQGLLPEEIKNSPYRKITRFGFVDVEARKKKIIIEQEKPEAEILKDLEEFFKSAKREKYLEESADRARIFFGDPAQGSPRKKPKSYKVILEKCGSETLARIELGSSTLNCLLSMDYLKAKEIIFGEYREGEGVVGEATIETLAYLVRHIKQVFSVVWHLGAKDIYEKKNIYLQAVA